MIDVLLIGLGVYAVIGLVVSAWLLSRGLVRLDPGLAASPHRVRLILLPGCIGLWPVLLTKVMRSSGGNHP